MIRRLMMVLSVPVALTKEGARKSDHGTSHEKLKKMRKDPRCKRISSNCRVQKMRNSILTPSYGGTKS